MIQTRLLDWYDASARLLPWRDSRDPYRIWISEIMLQQTQVVTVIPYFQRFMNRFPDVNALAAGDLHEVLMLWQGLGYYSRARNMHRAARIIVEQYSGIIPEKAADLLSLPGIGRYTAGAIASIAHDEQVAVLDGNVIRVLCRLFQIDTPPGQSRTRNQLWSISQSLVPTHRPGDHNQAMMELGATLCTPTSPQCPACPLKTICQARQTGRQEQLPIKKPAKTLPHYIIGVAVIIKNGKVLIDRRKPQGLLGGLWEFPGGKQQEGETIEQTIIREVQEELGITVEPLEPLIQIKHAYSHFRVTLVVWRCRPVSGRARPIDCDACKWIPIKDLVNYPFPAANAIIIQTLLA